MDELKKTIEALNKAFEDFKVLNDKRLAAIEAKGSAPAELEAAVTKANDDITSLSAKLDEQKQAQHEMETLVARIEMLGRPRDQNDQDRVATAQFLALTQRQPVDIDAVTPEHVEQFHGYRQAFFAYLRRGDKALAPEIQAALTVGSDPEGGFWVPPDTAGRIAQLVYETSPMRQFAGVQQIGTDALEGVNDLNEAGGGWVAETGARSETTTPDIGKWRIPVHEQYAEPRVTQKMLDDAQVNAESWLEGKIARKLGRMEATANVNGSGVTQPRGFLQLAAGTPSAATWNVIEQTNTGVNGDFAAAPNGGDVFITALGLVKADYRPGLIWAMNRTTEAAARKEKDSQGRYIWQPNFQQGSPAAINGIPVALFEDMPVMATNSLSIALANFMEGYQIVDRVGIRLLRDPYTAKPYVKLYTTRRVGGDVVNFEAIKLIKFAA